MGAVRVVTDGAADLPPSLATSLGITTVRGGIRFGDEPWDGTVEDFWQRVAHGASPSAAAPSADALAEAFASDAPVCAVHASAELSRTFDHAREAADLSPNRVDVIDTRSLSIGLGLIAVAAASAARLDMSSDDIRDLCAQLADRVHVHAVIDDVGYLVRGGRAGLVEPPKHGRQRQVIAVQGHTVPLGQHRDRARAVRHLLDHLGEHARHGIDRWALAHGDADDVDDVVSRAGKVLGGPPEYVVPIGAPVGAHAGPAALVVGFVGHAR